MILFSDVAFSIFNQTRITDLAVKWTREQKIHLITARKNFSGTIAIKMVIIYVKFKEQLPCFLLNQAYYAYLTKS